MPEELNVATALVAGIAIGVFSGVAIMAMLFAGRGLDVVIEAAEDGAPPVPPAAPMTPYVWLEQGKASSRSDVRCHHGAPLHQWCDDCYRQGAGL